MVEYVGLKMTVADATRLAADLASLIEYREMHGNDTEVLPRAVYLKNLTKSLITAVGSGAGATVGETEVLTR